MVIGLYPITLWVTLCLCDDGVQWESEALHFDEKQTLWFHSLSDQHGCVQMHGMILIALVRVPEHHCGDASGNPNRI